MYMNSESCSLQLLDIVNEVESKDSMLDVQDNRVWEGRDGSQQARRRGGEVAVAIKSWANKPLLYFDHEYFVINMIMS